MESEKLPEPRRILLVEDEEAHVEIIRRAFERNSTAFQLAVSSTLAEAARAIELFTFDMVIADWRLPDGEGLQLLAGKPIPLLIMTSHGNEQIAVQAMKAGAIDYVVKSERSLLDMPRIVEAALRMQANTAARELAERDLRIAEESLRERMIEEEWLRKSERRLRVLADTLPQIMWTARPNGIVDYYNHRWYEYTGMPKEEEGDDGWTPVIHPDDLSAAMACWYSSMDSGQLYEVEARLRDHKSGSYLWHLARALPVRNDDGEIEKWVGTATNIDEHKRQSEQLEVRVGERTSELRHALEEKVVLLKEVHHRVKNNLQVVCSFLSIQGERTREDSLSRRSLNDAYSRVMAMSLIHQQIYDSETLSDLDFGAYIGYLADRLFSTYCVDPSRIRLEQDVQPIHISVDDAVPCGLVLNELLSNCLKHAFPGHRSDGVIRVSFTKDDCGVALSVADNGIGMPEGFQLEKSDSLGMQVVRTLARQLRANLTVGSEGGTTFKLRWTPSEPATG